MYGGKAHPRDEGGKALIRKVFEAAQALIEHPIRVVYVPNYDWRWAQLMTSGVDLWLNTPQRPHEASGTSGMKAALNGVPSLSVPDGWWLEGHIEGVTGWGSGPRERSAEGSDAEDAADLYRTLEETILPIYHDQPERWTAIMRATIAFNASFFNSQRMLEEYVENVYGPATRQWRRYVEQDFLAAKRLAVWKAKLRAAWSGVGLRRVHEPTRRIGYGGRGGISGAARLKGPAPGDVAGAGLLGRPGQERAPQRARRERRGTGGPPCQTGGACDLTAQLRVKSRQALARQLSLGVRGASSRNRRSGTAGMRMLHRQGCRQSRPPKAAGRAWVRPALAAPVADR